MQNIQHCQVLLQAEGATRRAERCAQAHLEVAGPCPLPQVTQVADQPAHTQAHGHTLQLMQQLAALVRFSRQASLVQMPSTARPLAKGRPVAHIASDCLLGCRRAQEAPSFRSGHSMLSWRRQMQSCRECTAAQTEHPMAEASTSAALATHWLSVAIQSFIAFLCSLCKQGCTKLALPLHSSQDVYR